MKSSPRVSVIIPTYNRASLLKKAVESVLNQTFTDYEIIIVDDGSTDNTREIVNSFSSSKIKYIYQKNNGRSNARNQALKIAKGEFIAFLDSDDMFVPDKLEKQISILDEKKDFGMIYTSARVFDDNDTELFSRDPFGNKRLYYTATDSGWIYDKIAFYLPLTIILPSVMVRSEIMAKVGGFDEQLHRFEDTDMWRRISKECKIFAISEPLCIIRSHSGNRMEHPNLVYDSINAYITKIFREDKDVNILFKMRGASYLFFHYALAVSSTYGKSFALKFFSQSFIFWPFHVIEFILSRLGLISKVRSLAGDYLLFVSKITPKRIKAPIKKILIRLKLLTDRQN